VSPPPPTERGKSRQTEKLGFLGGRAAFWGGGVPFKRKIIYRSLIRKGEKNNSMTKTNPAEKGAFFAQWQPGCGFNAKAAGRNVGTREGKETRQRFLGSTGKNIAAGVKKKPREATLLLKVTRRKLDCQAEGVPRATGGMNREGRSVGREFRIRCGEKKKRGKERGEPHL